MLAELACNRCPGKMHPARVTKFGHLLSIGGIVLVVLGLGGVVCGTGLMLLASLTSAVGAVVVGLPIAIGAALASLPLIMAGLVFAGRRSVWQCGECTTIIERA